MFRSMDARRRRRRWLFVVPVADFPRKTGNGKFEVIARGRGGRFVRVIFIYSPPGVVYVIHAMPL